MSAAEKLKALTGPMGEDDRTCMACLTNYTRTDAIAAALQQIVAVVEAAERVSEKERTGTLPDFLPMAVALAALDEALT